MYLCKPSKNTFEVKWDITNNTKNNSDKGTVKGTVEFFAPVHLEQ